MNQRITTRRIRQMKNQQRIVALTAYDYTTAKLVDAAQVDIILIGDSLGMVIQGEETTIPVTLDQMIYHCRIVSKAVQRALVVGDMPFASYSESIEQGYRNAIRVVQDGRVSAVKLEGGFDIIPLVQKLTKFGVPVMGHIGLQPQSVLQYGGYVLQGNAEEKTLIEEAKALEGAGAFCIVLEKVSVKTAEKITNSISIPTIGIASGPYCDGQILVFHDVLGLQPEVHYKFVRRYAEIGLLIKNAIERYANDVRESNFPSINESYE
ncbi:MAG: 3-methyl-2-oxobutanoate hydroxymethyltransferase [bacterium]|nr:3-methyl-2-oxobutanoate hydroxymethyltransferase [bacterium]